VKQHRIIWYFTAAVVAVCAVIVMTRRTSAPAPLELTPGQADRLVKVMLECLETDQRAVRVPTKRLVEEVARLADSGKHETAETEYALGLWHYRTKPRNLKKAETAFRKAIAMRPDWNWSYNGLGLILQSMGRDEEALEAFLKAVELEPTWSRPHNNLAVLLRTMGRLEEAQEKALTALKLDPDNVATQNNYGTLLVDMKRFEEAEAAFKKAIELDPGHPSPYYNMACLASLRGNVDEALGYLNSAVVLAKEYREEAMGDPDFEAIRDLPQFRKLIYGDE
jgi:Flp pilus assembly protein TadD